MSVLKHAGATCKLRDASDRHAARLRVATRSASYAKRSASRLGLQLDIEHDDRWVFRGAAIWARWCPSAACLLVYRDGWSRAEFHVHDSDTAILSLQIASTNDDWVAILSNLHGGCRRGGVPTA